MRPDVSNYVRVSKLTMSNEIMSTMNMMGHGSQYAFGVSKVCGAVTGIYKFINLVPHELSV